MSKLLVATLLTILLLAGCSLIRKAPAPQEPVVKPPLPVTAEVQKAIAWLPYIVAICVFGLGVAVALVAGGSGKLGIMIGAGAGASLGAAIMVAQWFWLIAYVLGALGLLVAIWVAWRVWQQRKALSEVVWTAEEAKKLIGETAKKMLFGDPAWEGDHGTAGKIQSPATEKLVAKIRANP